MNHMVIKKFKKHLRLYTKLLKFSLITSTTYHIGFLISIIVDVGYQITFILFFKIIYQNVSSIAGWNYYEVLFLAGLDIVTSATIFGLVCIYNLRRLPDKIRNGDMDLILTKPINSLFGATFFTPYITIVIDSLSGVFLMIYSLHNLNLKIKLIDILSTIFLLVCGQIIAYCLVVIPASLSFVFLSSTNNEKFGEKIILFSSNPHHIYEGLLRKIFFYVLPIVFISSIPAYTILRGAKGKYLLLGAVLAIILLFITIKLWNKMIKYYSSASS